MSNVYRYTLLFFLRVFFYFYFFIDTHEYAKSKNLHISTLNKITMSGLQFGTKVGSLG